MIWKVLDDLRCESQVEGAIPERQHGRIRLYTWGGNLAKRRLCEIERNHRFSLGTQLASHDPRAAPDVHDA
jgi:hypothetical protein